MKYSRLLVLLLTAMSCQRELAETPNNNPGFNIDCYALRQGMIENDISMISGALGPLTDQQYSNDNLIQLAKDISSSCDMTATLTCFNCVKTVPPQSQLQCTFIEDNGDYLTYTINLDEGRNNRIEIVSVN